ncbi:acyl-CoA dehydrogenase [Alkalilimnicola ehrlichii]|uniref:acyl-CoA dehydrogenase family protein n=1 Tax=Alkalilimnicola ehrlichii TaxID=351052 RepID=UPI000E2EEC5F|nr:acyl-CoA dehydrogenase family protein [Alkalilimnicola ehrlichii]RFA29957.1 acyl-CoA dehydrogenase [Alkalilimnicola ehrlichii]
MDFAYSDRVEALRRELATFMDRFILPYNDEWHRETRSGRYPLTLLNDLKALAKDEQLWNLFLPDLPETAPGQRLSNLEYAPLAEIMGRIPWASEAFNCSAPDSGNMELLHRFGSEEQKQRWLTPLFEGEIRSCFAMSEPDTASADPTNLQTSIRREGDEYVINGRKWFVSGANHPQCRLVVVVGNSDPGDKQPPHQRHSMILVPMDSEGLNCVRNIPVLQHEAPEGHCELVFRNVRVPAEYLLGELGGGFAMAQARLGPGRVHHCMRSIGQCELALELMRERALERRAFGKYLHEYANLSDWIAQSRLEIEQARLLVLHAAWLLDTGGNEAARSAVAGIKVVVAQLQTRIVDRAIQVFGAMGLSPDTPLSYLWTWGRALRILDGPDEVHLRTVAREEMKKAREQRGETMPYFTLPENL